MDYFLTGPEREMHMMASAKIIKIACPVMLFSHWVLQGHILITGHRWYKTIPDTT